MKKLFVLIAAACMTYTAAFAQTVKPFKEGERAVFLGNSITDGGHYHSYIWLSSNPQLSSSASFLRLNVLSSLN